MKAEHKIRGQWVSEEVYQTDIEKRIKQSLLIYGVAYIEDLGGGLKRVIDPKSIQVRTPYKPLPWYKRIWKYIRNKI